MKSLKMVLVFIVILFVFAVNCIAEDALSDENNIELYRAKVLEIKDLIEEEYEQANITITTQIAEIKILNKDLKGEIIEIENVLSDNPVYDIELSKGDIISVNREIGEDGTTSFYVMSYERVTYLWQILAIFLILLIILGGWKGIKSILSLALTILLILYFLIPMLLKGYNPIILSVITCAVSTVATLVIISGINRKSISAITGTIFGITVGGIIAYTYGALARLTGFDSSEAQMLMYIPQEISFDFRGLLFAGILIGALGAAMDVSISIASALNEISEKDETLSFNQIIKHGMNIGRDIMGTMSNTLILAYTGGALSMLLIFAAYQRNVNEIINLDIVATEIVRAIAGSIGLLCAIPITAVTFGLLKSNKNHS